MSLHVPVAVPKCPRCKGSDISKLDGQCALCRPCSRLRRGVYYFCWACRREWPTAAKAHAACSLAHCALRAALLSDKLIVDPDSSALGCPFFRACPQCKALLTHDGKGCPNMVCPQCHAHFCFRCLRQRCYGIGVFALQQMLHEHCPETCTIVDNSRSLAALGL
ncbi:E3 ubiquitin-protein ligase lubel-like [Electrophorus electricus]|uniref:Si:ch211-284e13.9 n=1 Tax=Electrophorus electricus TaxID=8005 RepID=A0AAY5EF67_ELEEL|nr:E3 ubiquitin-protein ligase lubel-like [Electrophorus electricus]